MSKTLSNIKIVLEENGTTINIYYWKRIFLCFGKWELYGTKVQGGRKISSEELDKIKDTAVCKTVCETLYDKFII